MNIQDCTRNSGRLRLALALALLSALFAIPVAAQVATFGDEMDKAQSVFDRTEEILEKVASEVREADVPKARDLLGAAVELQKRARRIYSELNIDGSALVARTRLRQSVALSLRSRDTALQAGKVLREQVSMQRRAQRILEQAADAYSRLRDRQDDGADSTARDLLRRVQSQLERAQRQFRDGNFEVALRLGQTSLELMQSLSAADGGRAPAPRYQAMLDQTKRALERAGQGGGPSDEASQTRLARAAELVSRSEDRFRAGHPRLAVELLERARSLIASLEFGPARSPEEIRQAVERAGGALSDLTEELGGRAPENVQRMLDRARQEHQRTLRALREGDVDQALRRHRATVDLLTRIRNWVADQGR